MSTGINIQAQDKSGNWRTFRVTTNNGQIILKSMKELQATLPEYRIRATDSSGRVVDIL